MNGASLMIDRVGMAGIMMIAGVKTGEVSGVITVTNSWGLSDFALLLGMFGTLALIVNRVIDSYIRVKEHRTKNNQ